MAHRKKLESTEITLPFKRRKKIPRPKKKRKIDFVLFTQKITINESIETHALVFHSFISNHYYLLRNIDNFTCNLSLVQLNV